MQTWKHVPLKKSEASGRQRVSSLASQLLDPKFFLRVKCQCALDLCEKLLRPYNIPSVFSFFPSLPLSFPSFLLLNSMEV